MDYKAILWAMVGIFIGNMIAGFIMPIIPFSLTGWLEGIVQGMIVVGFMALFGIMGKMGLMQLLLGGIVIFVGSILGATVADFIGMSGWFSTGIQLLIQALLLSWIGLLRGSTPSLKV